MLNTKTRMRMARGLVYVLLVLLVWQLARIMLLAMSGPSVPRAVLPPLPEWRSSTTAPTQGLAQWHLFGEAAQGFDLSAFAQLPDTPLQLTLRGIVATRDDELPPKTENGAEVHEGYAMIADAQGKEDVYRRGDQVPGGAEVVSVQSDQVILLRNGKRETLRLPGAQQATTTAGAGIASAPANSRGGRSALQSSAAQPAVRNLPGIRGPAPGAVSIGGAIPQLSGLRMNAAALASSVQVAPVKSGGFRVFPGRNAQVFQQLGLQANDVVTQVNGQAITSQADAMAIFQQVQGGKSLTLTVRRGDRDVILKPDLNSFISNNQP
jgi:general secretion pathway protein C